MNWPVKWRVKIFFIFFWVTMSSRNQIACFTCAQYNQINHRVKFKILSVKAFVYSGSYSHKILVYYTKTCFPSQAHDIFHQPSNGGNEPWFTLRIWSVPSSLCFSSTIISFSYKQKHILWRVFLAGLPIWIHIELIHLDPNSLEKKRIRIRLKKRAKGAQLKMWHQMTGT